MLAEIILKHKMFLKLVSVILTAWGKSSGELGSVGQSQGSDNEDDGLHGVGN